MRNNISVEIAAPARSPSRKSQRNFPRYNKIILAGVLLLAGCGGKGTADNGAVSMKNASVADVTAKAKDLPKQQPGEWKTTTRILKLESSDIPKGSAVAKLMQEQMQKEQTDTTCVTADRMQRPLFERAVDPTGKCRYDHFSMQGGRIDAQLECPAPDGPGTVVVQHKGTFGATSFDVQTTMTRKDATGKDTGTTTMEVKSQRVGDCSA